MHFFFDKEKKTPSDLVNRLERACEGLVYISETDAHVTVFVDGAAGDVNVETIRAGTNSPEDAQVVQTDFHDFFIRLTKSHDWHTDVQREQTKKFLELEKLLEENLHGLKVFKIGRVRLDIYAVGIDRNGNLLGVKTQAVET